MSSGRGVAPTQQRAEELRCVRPGCRHRWREHAPGGAGCLYWYPLNGDHCECRGFRWVELPADAGPPAYRGRFSGR